MPIRERVVGARALEAVSSALGDRARDLKENFGTVDLVCDPDQIVSVIGRHCQYSNSSARLASSRATTVPTPETVNTVPTWKPHNAATSTVAGNMVSTC